MALVLVPNHQKHRQKQQQQQQQQQQQEHDFDRPRTLRYMIMLPEASAAALEKIVDSILPPPPPPPRSASELMLAYIMKNGRHESIYFCLAASYPSCVVDLPVNLRALPSPYTYIGVPATCSHCSQLMDWDPQRPGVSTSSTRAGSMMWITLINDDLAMATMSSARFAWMCAVLQCPAK